MDHLGVSSNSATPSNYKPHGIVKDGNGHFTMSFATFEEATLAQSTLRSALLLALQNHRATDSSVSVFNLVWFNADTSGRVAEGLMSPAKRQMRSLV